MAAVALLQLVQHPRVAFKCLNASLSWLSACMTYVTANSDAVALAALNLKCRAHTRVLGGSSEPGGVRLRQPAG